MTKFNQLNLIKFNKDVIFAFHKIKIRLEKVRLFQSVKTLRS